MGILRHLLALALLSLATAAQAQPLDASRAPAPDDAIEMRELMTQLRRTLGIVESRLLSAAPEFRFVSGSLDLVVSAGGERSGGASLVLIGGEGGSERGETVSVTLKVAPPGAEIAELDERMADLIVEAVTQARDAAQGALTIRSVELGYRFETTRTAGIDGKLGWGDLSLKAKAADSRGAESGMTLLFAAQ